MNKTRQDKTRQDKILKWIRAILIFVCFIMTVGAFGGYENNAATFVELIKMLFACGMIGGIAWLIGLFIVDDSDEDE